MSALPKLTCVDCNRPIGIKEIIYRDSEGNIHHADHWFCASDYHSPICCCENCQHAANCACDDCERGDFDPNDQPYPER